MFTGIVEELGRVRRLERRGDLQRLRIEATRIIADLQVGDSVNISGACQTAVAVDAGGFAVESVGETLRRTTLGDLRVGDPVNLERALRPDSRLGGHFVLGHVDGVGRVTGMAQHSDSWTLTVEGPAEIMRYIATKGSVTVDGVSLTVAAATATSFAVAVIPHTFENTTLAQCRQGGSVNLEVDVIARYLERLLSSDKAAGLTWESLRDLGY